MTIWLENLEKEVPTLNLCLKLKRLGFPQECGSGFCWVKRCSRWEVDVFTLDCHLYHLEAIKAPTIRELAEWVFNNNKCLIRLEKTDNNWIIYSPVYLTEFFIEDKSIANVYAKALIWLVENDCINFNKKE